MQEASDLPHRHVFLAVDHASCERRTWAVIWLCGVMMFAEIVGGLIFGSIALVADGLHMSTHAGALLLAAVAYRYASRHTDDARFTFGTGKLGDLAGFTSAIVLAMIAVLIGYEAIIRLVQPLPIRFAEAIPIAFVGLGVNIASAWLLSRDGHHHPGEEHGGDDRSRLFAEHTNRGNAHRDNNMRAAIIHVAADAAVSIFVIVGLVLARTFGWLWMDPVAGIAGAMVIASWSYGLIRDTGAILLDMNPDRKLAETIRATVEREGDRITDFHLWRIGPGHLAAIISVVACEARSPGYYRSRLAHITALSHVTVEITSVV
jgi:cation diffusion facilitator family transporter